MADGSSGSTWISTLFSTTLYTINVQDTGDEAASAFDSTKIYSTDAIYTVELSEYAETLPLALLYCMFEIALSDVAAHKAENYMAKIEANQELQSAASTAIVAGEALLDGIYETMDELIAADDDWIGVDDFETYLSSIFVGEDAYGGVTVNYAKFVETTLDYLTDAGAYSIDIDNSTVEVSVDMYINIYCTDSDGNAFTLYYWGGDGSAFDDPDYEEGTYPTPNFIDKNTNVLDATSVASLTNDILNACVLADITEIGGVALYEVDENGDAAYTVVDGEVIYTSTAALTSDQLETLLEELELAQENASSTTQTDMVYAEEYLGQYNSYLTGSSSTLDDYSSSLMSIAGRIG
ncbi:MAG: hypothetical protein R3Y11_05960 [Pseudomonadota bacterium]